MLALVPMMMIHVLLIVQQLVQFSRFSRSNTFFSYLVMRDVNVSIIYNTTNLFEGIGRAIILLPRS